MTYLPDSFYTVTPTTETVLWVAAFAVMFILALVVCWYHDR